MIAEATPLAERTCTLAALAGRVERCTEDCPLLEDEACSLEALLEAPSQAGENAWVEPETTVGAGLGPTGPD